ncbi:MAG: M15 family metallopeptidase [Clostridia bacterium]|nr:M15 family metallopeptidase [Clostridia bacterium]
MKKSLTLVLLGVLAVVLLGYGIVSSLNSGSPTIDSGEISDFNETQGHSEEESTDSPTNDPTDEPSSEQATTSAPEIIEDYAYAYAGFNPAYANMDISDWRMILVNRDYILPDGYMPVLEPAVEGDYEDIKLDYRVAPYYNEMYQAALEDGVELVPISGYRSVERQTRNFENKIQKYINDGYSKTEATQMAATIILPPGTSEHNAGLAMDICSLYESFEKTEEFEWLSENAADYGFIMRYPEDKQDITKIIYEPWHWRYVGVEAAQEMKASGQCLEEYLGLA